jgi:hypothetical protein
MLEADNYGDGLGGDVDSDDAYDIESDLEIGASAAGRTRKAEAKSHTSTASTQCVQLFVAV